MSEHHATVSEGTHPANHLAGERSPYLLQHLHNPVDWYPWNEETFQLAKRLDKPVFVSIGYSTCHWCHVMAHESFEDVKAAEALNEAFVCCKVDREERPDVDSLYMGVCQAIKGGGGWPLNVVVTPDKKPFYVTTYLPKPNLLNTVKAIKKAWESDRENVIATSEGIIQAIKEEEQSSTASEAKPGILPDAPLVDALFSETADSLVMAFDGSKGGFGRAPKFPSPHVLSALLVGRDHSKSQKDKDAMQGMVEHTLNCMRRGGIWDHVGKGFHRYATDPNWNIPHFEKMLYDQAGIAIACLETFQVTRNQKYADLAKDIFEYVLRDLSANGEGEEGAFYSAEDADSEGVEGKFYIWTAEQIRQVLNEKADFFLTYYEGKKDEEPVGLHLLSDPPAEHKVELRECLDKLYQARSSRVRPHLDKNILTDWNSFMAISLAKGARVLGDPQLALAATKCVRFMISKLLVSRSDTQLPELLHHFKDGHASVKGSIDDYGYFLQALCEVHMLTFEPDLLSIGDKISTILETKFLDQENGGFWFSPIGSELLPGVRKKETYDGAIPAGSSAAVKGLLLLGLLTEDLRHKKLADHAIRGIVSNVASNSVGHAQMLINFDLLVGPSYTVTVCTETSEAASKAVHSAFNSAFIPRAAFLWDHNTRTRPGGDPVVFFPCSWENCLPPVSSVPDLVSVLTAPRRT